MALIQAQQADLSGIWPKLTDGDTLELHGPIMDSRVMSKRTFSPTKRLVVDGSKATIGGAYLSHLGGVDWHNLNIVLGTSRLEGFRIDHADDMSFTNVNANSPDTPERMGNVGHAIWLNGGSNIRVDGLTNKGFQAALTCGGIAGLSGRNFDISEFGGDGIDIPGCTDVWLREGKIYSPHKTTTIHPDAIQMWSQGVRSARILIEHFDVNGHMQGINHFNHPTSGQVGAEDITIRHCKIAIDYVWAIDLQDVERPCVEDVEVWTQEGDVAQARINFGYSDGSKPEDHGAQRFGNTVHSYTRYVEIIDPIRTTYPKFA